MFNEKNEKSDKRDEQLKIAFDRIKNDIFSLGNELLTIKTEFIELKSQLNRFDDAINKLKIDIFEQNQHRNIPRFTQKPTQNPTHIPTHLSKKPTIPAIPTDTPTVPMEVRGLKYPNFDISSGNRGVPTDRQTNQQTDKLSVFPSLKPDFKPIKPLQKNIEDAQIILDSLDSLKKEIRLKFKQMTQQEMLVFSTIYQLEDQYPEGVEYKHIALKLGLSESSIRDYTQKLINKGIPVDKLKLNNKKILLKISEKLKNIAPLETIIKLREL